MTATREILVATAISVVLHHPLSAQSVTVAEPATTAATSLWSTSPAIGLGPLTQGSQSPVSLFRLSHPVGIPATLGAGQWELHSQHDWANYFCDGGDHYLLDFESLRSRLGFAYGVTERTQIGIMTSVSYQGGGILDGFIEDFERAVGAIDYDRRRAPRDRFLLRVRGRDGTVHEFGGEDSGWHGENVSIELKHQALPGSEARPALAATIVVKLPVSRTIPGRPRGGVDVGASLDAGQRVGRFHVYGSLAAVSFGTTDAQGVELLRYQLSLMTAVELHATPRTSVLLQSLVSSAVARHFGGFSMRSREVAIGMKHAIGRDWLFEFSVVENILIFNNDADVAFHSGLTWRSAPNRRAS